MAVIYVLTNKENGKQYVGKTVRSLDIRWKGHVGSARRGDCEMMIARAIKKYGIETFIRTVLEECDESIIDQQEIYWIDQLKTHVLQGGYNLTFGGGGQSGHHFSEESKEKMRQKAIGRKHTEETKRKMSAAKLGKKQLAEHVIARALKNTGKKRSEDACRKISEALLGRVVSDETRLKISIASSQRILSEETKQKLRLTSTGRKHTNDAKHKISLTHSKAIQQFDEHDNLVGTYRSMTEAAKLSGCSSSSISRSILWKKLVTGYRWQHVLEVKNEHI